MKFKFECPHCGQRISATEADVNTVGVCPACRRDVNVPALPTTLKPPVAVTAYAVAPKPPAAAATPPPTVRQAQGAAPAPAVAPPAAVAAVAAAHSPPVAPSSPKTETPSSQPTVPPVSSVPPPVTQPKRAPMRPAKPAVVPQPTPKRVPPAFADIEFDEPERPRPGVPIFTFIWCVIPIPALIALRYLGLLDIAPFQYLLSGAALICVVGLIMAHRAWGRSKGRFFARAVAVLGLVSGYLSAFAIATIFTAISTGAVVLVKPAAEPPAFKPEDGGDLTKPAPAATPAAVAVASPAPAPPPATTATAAAEFPAEQLQFFEGKIRPILADKCYKCHSIEAGKSKGKLTLDTREGLLKGGETGPGVKPGDPDGSILIKAVLYTDSDLQMPPKGEKLSDAEIADLVAWVKMGAPDPRKGK
jgi:hypothetical protein